MDGNYSASELKKKGRQTLRKHYLILVLLCLFSVMFGTEYTQSLQHTRNLYSAIVTKDLSHLTSFKAPGEDTSIQVFNDIADNRYKEGKETSEKSLDSYKNLDDDPVMGRRKGVFAQLFNNFTSGHLYIMIFNSIYKMTKSDRLSTVIFLILALIFYSVIWIFLRNIYKSILRRYFLEARTYDHMPANHLLFIKVVKKWINVSLTLLYQAFLEQLWWFTIVGGLIKSQSYSCVPYIEAENPSVTPTEAINLSRRMMDGHKMKLFMMKVTFIPWSLLGMATFGISEFFYSVPYKFASYTEFYVYVRNLAIENKIEGYELLNDRYLYEKADDNTLEEAYPDILKHEEYIKSHEVPVTDRQAFFIKYFGIWYGSTENKLKYEQIEGIKSQIIQENQALDRYVYPQRLNPNWEKSYNRQIRSLDFIRNYTIWNLIMIFFLFSVFGWMWEVSIHLFKDGVFVNRGTMHGPWLPIYGSGVVMMLTLLARYRAKPLREILSMIVLCGIVEYGTSLALELIYHTQWWNYNGYFLNLNGRICAEGLTVFAIGGAAAVYIIAPVYDEMLSRLNLQVVAAVAIIISVMFTGDFIYSMSHPNTGKGITDYEQSQVTVIECISKEKDKNLFKTGRNNIYRSGPHKEVLLK